MSSVGVVEAPGLGITELPSVRPAARGRGVRRGYFRLGLEGCGHGV
jgi:hypothetical protein